MIKVQNLVKKFITGDIELTALKGLTFDVPTGQFLAITGKSGSGKSTLLYQLGILDHANEGIVSVDGLKISELKNEERVKFRRNNLGFIFQDYAILPTLTAIENVIVPILMQGFDNKSAQQKAQGALDRVGLGDKLHNLPSQLSGGQQQRVSIARAIAHDPKILFADEPTANLDSESSDIILDIFLKLHKNGQTIVFVTHEPEYAKLANRNIVLKDGEIIKDILLKK